MPLKPGETLGEIVDAMRPIPIDAWRKVIDAQGQPTGEVMRDRFLPMAQVFQSARAYLAAKGQGTDGGLEHFDLAADIEHLTWPSDPGEIACYATSASNDGWHVYVCHVSGDRIRRLFVGKSTHGFDQAFSVAHLLAVGLDA